jgi:beta-galactosidase
MTIDRKRFLLTGSAQVAALSLVAPARAGSRSITIDDGKFVLDGKPFQFISGEMHYVRIPKEYWRHRLRMARAMGLNTVSTYVFWNVHEPEPGTYDFSGRHDVAAFLRTAQEEGLHAILRPGPYVCGEWDFGGLPAWLLKDPATLCRTQDPTFMAPVRRWLQRLGKELAPLQWTQGGLILAVQIENEYGSFGDDHAYMRQIYEAISAAGFDRVIRYTEDGTDRLADGSLPSLPVAGSITELQPDFAALRRFRPDNPVMAGEYYPGWFDHWGEPHHVTDAAQQVRDVEWMLAHGSFNLYVVHGGTNWFMNGANYADDAPYQPTTTSYDYDAPIDEAGRPRPKYFQIRDAIARYTGMQPPNVPAVQQFIAIPEFTLDESAPLRDLLASPVDVQQPLHMEAFGQSYGYILYRTRLPENADGLLAIDEPRDYAVVLIDGKAVGTIDRRLSQRTLRIDAPKGAQLDILIENSGRLNYGPRFIYDRKGITKAVTMDGTELLGWSVYTLPMTEISSLRFEPSHVNAPAFYRGTFDVDDPADTFLDVRSLGKGLLWINDRPAGRFWEIGPQLTLYVPAPFLKRGRNEVVVFDLLERASRTLRGRTGQAYATAQANGV